MRILVYLLIGISGFGMMACRSAKKIQTAISRKDTAQLVRLDHRFDSAGFIRNVINRVDQNRIDFNTFSAKIKVNYSGSDGKNYDFIANLRMQKDSVIWVTINYLFGIEVFRIMITPDSVKVLNKLDKVAQFRSLSYLQDVTQLPIDFHTLQQLIIGNPVFLDSNIVSFKKQENTISLTSIGSLFKHLITVDNDDYLVLNSKLDDTELGRSRTAILVYDDYDQRGDQHFSTKRKISVSEKKSLDVNLDFKQYDFNGNLSYPFNVPKNYRRD